MFLEFLVIFFIISLRQKMVTFWLATLLLCVVCNAHTVHLGRTCPDIQAFPNLSVDKILGLWFVAYQSDTLNSCLVWNLTRSETHPEQLQLTESKQLYLLDAIDIDHKHAVTAIIDVPNPELPSRMRIRWPTSLTGKADFIVFDTDYEKYLAIFECNRAGIIHRRSATILSKTPKVDDMFVRRVRRLLDNAYVSHRSLDKISHNDCREKSHRSWHMEGDLFGLIPPSAGKRSSIKELSKGIHDYDISEIEIIGDGVEGMKESFRGSIQQKEAIL